MILLLDNGYGAATLAPFRNKGAGPVWGGPSGRRKPLRSCAGRRCSVRRRRNCWPAGGLPLRPVVSPESVEAQPVGASAPADARAWDTTHGSVGARLPISRCMPPHTRGHVLWSAMGTPQVAPSLEHRRWGCKCSWRRAAVNISSVSRGAMAWFTRLSNWCVCWWGGEHFAR